MSDITITSTTDDAQAVANAMGVEVAAPEAGTTAAPESGGDSGTPKTEEQPKEVEVKEVVEPEEPDTAEAADEAGEPEEEAEPVPPPKKSKGGFQKKIDKLTGENYRLQQENVRRQQEYAELQKQLSKPPVVAQDDLEAEPAIEKFTTIDEFLKAHAGWTRKAIGHAEAKATKAATAEAEKLRAEFTQNQEQMKREQTARAFEQRKTEAKALYKDYDKVLDETDVTVSPALHRTILNHPLGAHLAYHIASNPEEAERINLLSENDQLLEIGSLLSRVVPSKAAPVAEAPKRKASKAPKPIEKTTGARPASTVKDAEYWANAPYQEYKAARNSGILK